MCQEREEAQKEFEELQKQEDLKREMADEAAEGACASSVATASTLASSAAF